MKQAAAGFGTPVPEYDGMAEVWVKDVETWQSIVTDPEFAGVVRKDDANFVQVPVHIMIGYDNTVIGDPV